MTWQAETRAFRASPSGTAVVLEIPLLDGEAVTSTDVRVERNRALINMAPQCESYLACRVKGYPGYSPSGPSGPAVLFWPFVIVILLVSAVLGRVTITPLKTYHWILLELGLTQARIEIALLVVAWLLILGYRKRLGKETGNAVFNLVQLGLVILSALTLFSLIYAIRHGLLGRPEMWIMGNGSNNYFLQWFQDRSEAALPQAWAFSVPIIFYRITMLAWALWLALALLRWLRWGWGCFSHNGIWRPIKLIKPKKKAKKGKEDTLELDVEE